MCRWQKPIKWDWSLLTEETHRGGLWCYESSTLICTCDSVSIFWQPIRALRTATLPWQRHSSRWGLLLRRAKEKTRTNWTIWRKRNDESGSWPFTRLSANGFSKLCLIVWLLARVQSFTKGFESVCVYKTTWNSSNLGKTCVTSKCLPTDFFVDVLSSVAKTH